MLTVYVDDLPLSGPASNQAEVWKLIRSRVDFEDPEFLDKYSGRTHVEKPLAKH